MEVEADEFSLKFLISSCNRLFSRLSSPDRSSRGNSTFPSRKLTANSFTYSVQGRRVSDREEEGSVLSIKQTFTSWSADMPWNLNPCSPMEPTFVDGEGKCVEVIIAGRRAMIEESSLNVTH